MTAISAVEIAAANNMDCVTLKRARLIFPLDRAIDATTEPPIPVISDNPVKNINSGTQMLTAAMPSPPMPRPTKIPSAAVTAQVLNIPVNVGKKIFPNKTVIFSFPKSISSPFRHKKTA